MHVAFQIQNFTVNIQGTEWYGSHLSQGPTGDPQTQTIPSIRGTAALGSTQIAHD